MNDQQEFLRLEGETRLVAYSSECFHIDWVSDIDWLVDHVRSKTPFLHAALKSSLVTITVSTGQQAHRHLLLNSVNGPFELQRVRGSLRVVC